MSIDRRIDKFVFCCAHCRLVAENLRHCPACSRKLSVVKEGYVASFLGDTVLKTDFPKGRKPSCMKDFPWFSVCTCSKCNNAVHAGEICPADGGRLKKEIIKLTYACKKDRILFSVKTICPVCNAPSIKVEQVHTVKFAV